MTQHGEEGEEEEKREGREKKVERKENRRLQEEEEADRTYSLRPGSGRRREGLLFPGQATGVRIRF